MPSIVLCAYPVLLIYLPPSAVYNYKRLSAVMWFQKVAYAEDAVQQGVYSWEGVAFVPVFALFLVVAPSMFFCLFRVYLLQSAVMRFTRWLTPKRRCRGGGWRWPLLTVRTPSPCAWSAPPKPKTQWKSRGPPMAMMPTTLPMLTTPTARTTTKTVGRRVRAQLFRLPVSANIWYRKFV